MAASWQEYLNEHRARFLDQFLELLRIPSISTDPNSKGEVRRAAEWTAERLRQAGIEGVRIMETGGHPVVYGEWLHVPDQPTLLIYGHFDVQPVDPLNLWTSPPFEPVIKDGAVYARGATDMKGNLLLPVIACEALLQTEGRLPVNVKFLFEGEEEIGSPNLAPFVAQNKDLLACDLVVSADGGNGSLEEPHVNVGTRGLCGLQVDLRTANVDLHSGGGGMMPNAIHALVEILDALRDAEGRILVDGFHDEVRPMTEAERAEIAATSARDEEARLAAGVKAFFGDPAFTPRERMVARPSLEINGIWGGFQGNGVKTVIPCEAHAKITCRLVPDQTPGVIRDKVIAHIQKVAPAYADVSVEVLPGEADPYVIPGDNPGLLALERVVAEMTGRTPQRNREGGTVPFVGMMKRALGVETITLGASQAGQRAHAPDEFYHIRDFERVQAGYCRFLHAMGR